MLPMQFSPLVKSSLEVIKVPKKSSSTSKQAFQKQQYRLRNVNKHKSRSSETSLITTSARSKRLLISFTTIYFSFLFFLFLHLLVNVFCSVCHRLSSVTPSPWHTFVLQVNMRSSRIETQSFINMVTFSVRFFGGRSKRSDLIKKSYA